MLHNLYEVNLIWDAANKVDEKLQSLTKLQQLCNVVFIIKSTNGAAAI